MKRKEEERNPWSGHIDPDLGWQRRSARKGVSYGDFELLFALR